MGFNQKKHGSVQEFDTNWSSRKEAVYNHWIKGKPQNQIQLAFRNHWLLFKELMKEDNYNSCLEVGCGRGSISSYFADNGYKCTLLDSSKSVLDIASNIFKYNGHEADFVNGDARNLPFSNNSFDVVVSIGLLEHFEDIYPPIYEQYRVLKPGGMFLGYIVPERSHNIQRYFHWLNKFLAFIANFFLKESKEYNHKTDLYRSDLGSEHYLHVIRSLAVKDVQVMGVYPLPMISHSPEFPFSLLPPFFEKILVALFQSVLWFRKNVFRKNPWICSEKLGQAFLVVFKKVS